MNLFQVTKKQPSGLELKTFTGNPVTFTPSYSEALPAPFNGTNLKVAIVATGGNGTLSTPIPIVGHSELNLVRCGKNFIRDEFVSGLPSTNIGDDYDTIITSTRYAYLNLPNISGNVTVSITDYDANYVDWVILFGYANGKLAGKHNITNYSGMTVNLSGYDHLRIIIGAVSGYTVPSAISTVGKVQLEIGSQATAYAPYNGTPYLVQFGQTVYGGVYDANAGKVRITWSGVDLGTQDWNEVSQRFNTLEPLPNAKAGNYIGCLCSIYKTRTDVLDRVVPFSICIANNGYCYIYDTRFNDEASFKLAMDGIIVAYELETVFEIDVSELSVDTIVGVNNIVSDCGGDVNVQCLI